MSEAIERYVSDVARRLWVKAERKRDILEELRSHLEAIEEAEGLLSEEAIRARFDTSRRLAGRVNRSMRLRDVNIPVLTFALICVVLVVAFPTMNFLCWWIIQIRDGWSHGLSAPLGSAAEVGIYLFLTIAMVLGGCTLAARASYPRVLLYLIALWPATYTLCFRVVSPVMTRARVSDIGLNYVCGNAFQVLVLALAGIVCAAGVMRLFRYPREEWHVE
ncbi:MAG: hypothetical protein JXR37_04810 [Kiritimatiellae bacterium]|nr:hypothetical protein [Kiritimatiellia bacterium]